MVFFLFVLQLASLNFLKYNDNENIAYFRTVTAPKDVCEIPSAALAYTKAETSCFVISHKNHLRKIIARL